LLLPIPKTVIGGNRHEMKLELTKQAREKYKGVRLREYVAVREVPV